METLKRVKNDLFFAIFKPGVPKFRPLNILDAIFGANKVLLTT